MSETDVVDGDAVEITAEEEKTPGTEVSLPEQIESQAVAIREEREAPQPPAAVLPSPGEWEATMTMARTIANTTFVPKAYRGNPEAVVAGILYGREIGLGPMQALQKVHIIDGKPSLAAEEMLAQMRRGGLVILKSGSTKERAFIHARRSDTGEEAEVEWTIEDAIDAGLNTKANWEKYRQDMLWARCVGRLCRRLGSDMVGGMVYAAEEMQDWDEGGYGGSGYDTPGTETPVGKLTNWRDPRFDPGNSLAKDAPSGWREIGKLALELDPTLPDWISEAVQKLYGSPVKELPDDKGSEAGRRIANVLTRIRDELFSAGDFPPPSADDYKKMFAWAFGGVAVEGPGTPFDSGIPEGEAEAKVEVDEVVEAELVEPEDAAAPAGQTPAEDIPFGDEPEDGEPVDAFDPATMRRDDAPEKKSGWKGISEVLDEVDPSLDWKSIMRQAIAFVYGGDGDYRKLEEPAKTEAQTRAANAAGRLTELFMAEPELSAESIKQAFAEMFEGAAVEVPEFKPESES
jgi:hypothetical protein